MDTQGGWAGVKWWSDGGGEAGMSWFRGAGGEFALPLRQGVPILGRVASYTETPLDRLWREYGLVFRDFDDLTLARWMAQTLSQVKGRVWRASHPLIGTYRLAAQLAHDRQIWLKRLATVPSAYTEAGCCRAPLLPLITRDVRESGLLCQQCGETCVPWDEIPADLQTVLRSWAEEYAPHHAVAHWEDEKRRGISDYDQQMEEAAQAVERLLGDLGARIAPLFLEHYPAIVWEDHDECLEVRPEDVQL